MRLLRSHVRPDDASVSGEGGRAEDTSCGAPAAGQVSQLECRFVYDGHLGDLNGRLTVWAPTAQSVELLHYTTADGDDCEVTDMARGPYGQWTSFRPPAWDKHFYCFR